MIIVVDGEYICALCYESAKSDCSGLFFVKCACLFVEARLAKFVVFRGVV